MISMVLRRGLVISAIVVCMVQPEAWATAKKNYSNTVTARAAILIDATKPRWLYNKNANLRVLPASTAKVMTALLVLEKLPLTAEVTVPVSATLVQPSKVDLRAGERYRVADLLFALLLNSANDASVVLAQAVAGSEWEFAKLMNARAIQLGAKNTRFVNSNGLPSKHDAQYTTPFDMSLIFREALNHSFFQQAISYRYKTIQSLDGRSISLKSHNKLLFSTWGQGIMGKTGYTRAAQACFIGYIKKGRSTLIIGVFGCRKRWDDIRLILRSYGGLSL